MPTYFKIQGVVENGGQQINTQGLVSTDKAVKVYPSATVTVYLTGTLTLATIYSDSTGTPKANPFTSDSTGFWFFFIAVGTYDIKFSGGDLLAPVTRSAITVSGSGVLPADIAYTDVANVFTENQRINGKLGINMAPTNDIDVTNVGPTLALTGTGTTDSASLQVINDAGKLAFTGINGSATAGNQFTNGPLRANTSVHSYSSPNVSNAQFGSDGAFWWATNNLLRAKLNSSALELTVPLQLDGATSGAVQVRVQAIAGNYLFDLPNNDPTVGDNVCVAGFSGGVVTLSYQSSIPAASADPVGIPAMLIGISTPSQKILLYAVNYSFNLPLTGSTAIAKTAATGVTNFDVQVNGVSKGTIRFAAAATVGAMVSPISAALSSGDLIEIIGPLVPDATLANVAFNLAGEITVPPTTPIGIATSLVGMSIPNQEVLIFAANSSFTLSVTGSTAIAKTAATAQTDFLIKVNTVTKGTLRFAASGTVASVVGASSTSISSGDLIEIIGPASPDLTLANIGFNLKGVT